MKKYNFYAGPSIIDPKVLTSFAQSTSKIDGISILERSHRGSEVQDLFIQTKLMLKEIMGLNDSYEVLFLHGGARLQNCMVPYNIKTQEQALYIDTGIWSKNSFEESCLIRETNLLASSEKENYSCIPKDYKWNGNGYLHLTSNNTVHGSQFISFPKNDNASLIVDMSSDILSRKLDFCQFDLIYAGLQKNLGTAGGTLVIIKKEILEDLPHLPSMLNYKKHVKAESMLNTPPVIAVQMFYNVLKWMQEEGGLSPIENRNNKKASLLYEEIDRNTLLNGFVNKEDRSLMNATFYLNDEKLDLKFQDYLEEKGIIGIKGHRSKGGYRVSMYNMLPLGHVEYLVDCLKKF